MEALRQTRITLVSIHPSCSPQSVPLAAAFLAAALKNAPDLSPRITVTLLDLYAEQTPQECCAAISATHPDMTGFSIYAWNRSLSAAAANLLKQACPDATLFCGGPEATADRQKLLEEAPWDFLVQGEGEAALVKIIRAIFAGKGVSGIPGCAVLDRGRLVSSPAAEMTALGEFPSPLLTGEIDPAKYSGMLWQLSRGCSFGCEFCFDGGGSRLVRHFPLERLEKELRWFAANRVSQVFVLDSTFNSDRERAVRILTLIRKTAPDIHFHFEVRSEFLDRQQAELFASITCSLQIGLQSADPLVLKQSGRNFSRTDFMAKAALLNNSGAVFGFDLIYGLPGDSLEGFKKSVDFAVSLYPNHLDIFPLALLPGTGLSLRSTELGLRHDPLPPYTAQSSPTFTEQEMAAAGRLAAACDLFYSRGKAVPWFMSLLHLLRMKPSRFFEAFYRFAERAGAFAPRPVEVTDQEIFTLQRDYLSELFGERKLLKLLPVTLDTISYNYHYAAALLATPPVLPSKRTLTKITPGDLRLTLAGSVRLAEFNYEILEILESGIADLRELAACFSPSGSTAVIYPKKGEVLTESLPEPHFRLLEQLDGSRPAGETAAGLGIPRQESDAFLRLALGEGIVALTAAD